MKKSVYLFSIALALTACNKSSNTQSAQPTAETDTTGVEMADTTSTALDSMKVDATTSATAKPNEVMFNGTIVLAPQRHATVSVTMGGVVKRTTLLPGQYVGKGQTVAVLQNPEFIALQQTYIDSYAQAEYLKKEYDRQKTLSTQQASPRRRHSQAKPNIYQCEANLMLPVLNYECLV